MECPYCGYTLDDRGYLSKPDVCPRCKSRLITEEPPDEEPKEPRSFGFLSQFLPLFISLALIVCAVITPWDTLRDSWFSFKEEHTAMSEKIPSYAEEPITADKDEIYESLSSIFDYTDNTLNRLQYMETEEEKDSLIGSLTYLYNNTDIYGYGKMYLMLNGESQETITTFINSLNNYMVMFKELVNNPGDPSLISQCRERNDTVAAIFGITYTNY